jgi:hypothetical protein
MLGSSDDLPLLLLEEGIASTPYMVKAALSEARSEAAATVAADLAEIETALALLKVHGWAAAETAGRPPIVRRNLLLLHSHLHRERLKALVLSEATKMATAEVVEKGGRLLDGLLSYSIQLQWVKATLAITALQALLTNGLWDHADDECRAIMRTRLSAVGLKLPKLSLRCTAADVFAGETVTVKVSAQRLHVFTAAELERYNATASGVPAEEGAPPQSDSAQGDAVVRVADAHEGWWLLVESVRSALIKDAQLIDREVHHNVLVGRQTLVPSLDDATMESSIEFTAPSAPGEYRVLVHLRSSSMVGVDVKRKVSFTVKSGKRSQPSTSSGTSTDDTKSMEEIDGTIADIIQEEEASTAPSPAPSTAPNTAPSTASLPTATPSPAAPAVPVS